MRHQLKLYFFLTCCIVFSPAVLLAADNCSSCHAEIMVKSKRARVTHAPVNQGHCDQCHIAGSKVSAPVATSPLAIEKKRAEKIRWFKRLSNREQEHWVRLPGNKMPNRLFLKATDGRMRTPVQELSLRGEGELDEVVKEKQPPRLENIQVTDVRRGISATATLQWRTDEHAESVVYYGVGNLRSVVTDRNLSRKHSVVLVSLEPDVTYQYQIVVRDLFGNESRSKVLEFPTGESFWNQDVSTSKAAADPFAADIELNWQVKRVDDDYVLILSADRPVSVSLGVQAEAENKTKSDRKVAVKSGFSHPILKSSFDTNITVCKPCHQDLREEYSHPIKIRARKGMIIPPEYPVLPDGKMSCMTCHDSHASNHEHRLRKSNKADLCRACHKNY